MGGQRHAQAALAPGKTRYPLYKRLGGSRGRSGRVGENLAPTGIRSPDRPARSESLYRLSYPGPHIYIYIPRKTRKCFSFSWSVSRQTHTHIYIYMYVCVCVCVCVFCRLTLQEKLKHFSVFRGIFGEFSLYFKLFMYLCRDFFRNPCGCSVELWLVTTDLDSVTESGIVWQRS